jgi:HEAT repeat protein
VAEERHVRESELWGIPMADAGKRSRAPVVVLLVATAGMFGAAGWALWPHWQAHRAVRQLVDSLPLETDAKGHAFSAAVSKMRRLKAAPVAMSELIGILKQPTGETIAHVPGSTLSIRSTACYALGRFGPDAAPAVPVLLDALRCDDTETRIQAARALGEIGPAARDALPALREAEHEQIERNSSQVRRNAESAIKKIEGGPGAVEVLLGQLQSPNIADERVLAAQALARIGPDARAAVPALKRALESKDPEVREEAAKALSRIDPDHALTASVK